MPHLLEALPHPAVIAHRGASRYAPQNTLAAFRLAMEQKADGLELDVRLSADGHLMVIHDATVRHLTNGRGWVANLTLAQLQALDAGQGEHVPTLDEVFETVGNQLLINVELKPLLRHTQSLAEKVAETVQRHHLAETVICSSFNPPALKALAWCAPEIPRGLLLPSGLVPARLLAWAGRTTPYQTLHPEYHDVLHGEYAPVHHPTHRIFTYTVNEETDMRRVFDMGVAGIFTDDPPLARRVRGF
jgi:glycerophosphoryl diester phosphodiesterase